MTEKNKITYTTHYIFHKVDTAVLAAIDFVIFKYRHHIWFNSVLNKLVTDIYVKPRHEICTVPFTITKIEKEKEEGGGGKIDLTYEGYHYIIYHVENYYRYFENKYYHYYYYYYNQNFSKIVCIINFAIFLFIIICYLLFQTKKVKQKYHHY